METISCTYHVRNEEVLQSQEGKENPTNNKKEGYLDWSHLAQNCLLKHVIKGKIQGRTEVMGRRRRSKQLPDDLKEDRIL
jgi:hypothetical protein